MGSVRGRKRAACQLMRVISLKQCQWREGLECAAVGLTCWITVVSCYILCLSQSCGLLLFSSESSQLDSDNGIFVCVYSGVHFLGICRRPEQNPRRAFSHFFNWTCWKEDRRRVLTSRCVHSYSTTCLEVATLSMSRTTLTHTRENSAWPQTRLCARARAHLLGPVTDERGVIVEILLLCHLLSVRMDVPSGGVGGGVGGGGWVRLNTLGWLLMRSEDSVHHSAVTEQTVTHALAHPKMLD